MSSRWAMVVEAAPGRGWVSGAVWSVGGVPVVALAVGNRHGAAEAALSVARNALDTEGRAPDARSLGEALEVAHRKLGGTGAHARAALVRADTRRAIGATVGAFDVYALGDGGPVVLHQRGRGQLGQPGAEPDLFSTSVDSLRQLIVATGQPRPSAPTGLLLGPPLSALAALVDAGAGVVVPPLDDIGVLLLEVGGPAPRVLGDTRERPHPAPDEAAPAVASRPPPPTPRPPARAAARRLLFADPHPPFVRSVQRAFLADLDVDTCTSVTAARERVAGGDVDCVLVDDRLADGSGVDLITALRGDGFRGPIVAISGREDANAALRAAGADATCSKLGFKHIRAVLDAL
ncbi:MAG: response regulator [Myxococcales bacterium]|nr:response regulator [Myxococcales bacterium]